MKPRLLLLVISIQILVIVFIFIQIQNKINSKFKISINPINSKSINQKPNGELKYFFEPKANTIEEEHQDWLNYIPKYTINNSTLNERFNYSVDKPKNTFRIITLGDSFTFGQYVNTKDNWTELLEDKLNSQFSCKKYKKIEVINLGVHAYDIQYSVERYRLRGQKYNPDLILWMLVDNQRIDEKLLPLLNQCSKDNQFLPNHNNCWFWAKNQYISQIGMGNIYKILANNFNQIFNFYNKKIVVIDINNSHKEILKNISKPDKINTFIINFGNKKELMLPNNAHPNKKGYEYFADSIFNYLIKNRIIPCN